ncbi:alpha/beta fold hydrolase [Nocardiopsis sediminis]|uniref:Alpha/beta fold hydrolase n=1 Tax=Nocardiopsis sediminis TaxID=1778267 RepID=A0ABV8FMH6_9ACTN
MSGSSGSPGAPRRRRRVLTALCVATAVLAAAGLAGRGTAPVGHFASADAKDAFTATYERAMAGLPEPDATLDVRTGYGIVRVYRFDGPAEGAPLVLLPGRASATPVWADNLPALLEARDVYTIDLLGEPGMSVQDRPIETDADQARWLNETLRALPDDRVHLLGLSIGGWTAANLATREPEKIASVTLVDPVFVFDDMPLETIVRSIPASISWLPRSWRDGFNSWTAGGAPVEDVPEADMIESGMKTYTLRLPQPTRIPEQRLRDLEPPVLAFIAGESVMHDPQTAAATARRALPDGSSVEVYPDASHAINGEYPDAIAADLTAFLDSVE